MTTLRDLQNELARRGDPARAAFFSRFFKCGPGEYGEGDAFRGGLPVPGLRALAREYRHLPCDDAFFLLESRWHEDRQLALFLLVRLHERGDARLKARIHRRYLARVKERINNWDLVDCSAPQLVGAHLFAMGDSSPLDKLARDRNLWRRRVAMVATLHFLRRRSCVETLRIAEALLEDREDLIHKAAGWMLREAGKRDGKALRGFLDRHAARMPRTMLRYAIERLPEPERRKYMAAKSL